MRTRWLIAAFLLVVLAAGLVVARWPARTPAERVSPAPQVNSAAEARPTEEVAPPPEVNPNAAIWRTPEPPGEAQAGDLWVNPKNEMEMVYVAAGEFLMGSAVVAPTDQKPQFRVSLPGYWIDRYEVTVAQYRKFCQETGREMPDAPFWGWQDEHPVVNVTWDEAAVYAKWAGERLPTEMEWEKAARGTDGRIYPWGNAWDRDKVAGHLIGIRLGAPPVAVDIATRPAGSQPAGASPYGAMDMAGNVWEWCADWYDKNAYKRYAKGDLKPPSSGNYRVLRGGSCFYDNPTYFSCAFRYAPDDGSRYSHGFRCVRGLP
jgi:formylglycine-generating enzyme required for sulfatase activity